MDPIHVQYCPQANEPCGGENPPLEIEATVTRVVSPFVVDLSYATGVEGARLVEVQNVPASRAPVPGCYRPRAGEAFPVGFVEALGAQAGGMAEEDDGLEDPPTSTR